MNKNFVFTSESVSEGHPDKVSDQVSDSVLDAFLAKDSASRVACETLVTTDQVVIAGEVSSQGKIDNSELDKIARSVINEIGYDRDGIGFNANTAKFDILLHTQSPDIAQGVTGEGMYKEEGAGDQGMMFGFAINETEALMPMPIYYSHKILESLAQIRKSKELYFLLPDAKSQVTVQYENGKPKEVTTVVVSTQHTEEATHEQITEGVIESCVKKVIPAEFLKNTKYFINPTGRFVIGGPHGDCGLTGRKIIVDTYGGFARHGGGAFSGKDPSKVDRSAAYMTRYIAKNIVAAGLADRCELQVAYAIGVAEPVSVSFDSFGTGKKSDSELAEIVRANFDLTPRGIRETLKLRENVYLPTARYGHFGREGASFPWERVDRAAQLS